MRGVPAPLPARGRRARRRRGAARAAPARRRPRRSATAAPSSAWTALEGDLLAAFRRRGERAKRRAAAVGGHARGAAAGRHRRRPAAADRRRAALAPAPLRRRGGLLASRVRLPARARAAAGRARPAVLLHRPERSRATPRRRWRRFAPVPGWSPSRSTGRPSSSSGPSAAIPSDPAYAEFHRASLEGTPPVGDRRGALRPGGGARAGRAPRSRSSPTRSPSALAAFRERRGKPGLVTFAIDTELLGHWWSEGPAWLEAVLRLVAGARHPPGDPAPGARAPRSRRSDRCASRPGARARTSAPGTRPRSPTSPGPRGGSSCACCARLGRGRARARRPPSGPRASCSRVQASDWAFLDRRRQAGDYPYQRSTAHARALLEAIHCRRAAGPPHAKPRPRPQPRPAARALSRPLGGPCRPSPRLRRVPAS